MKPSLPLFVASAFLAAILTPSQAQLAGRDEPIAFDKLRVDPKEWTKKDEPMVLGEVTLPVTVETPHFLIGVDERISNSILTGYANGLERTWLDLRQDLPLMDEVLAGRKMLVLLIDTREQMDRLGEYYAKVAEKNDWYREYSRTQTGWSTAILTRMMIDPALRKERSLLGDCRVFLTGKYPSARQRDPSWHRRVFFVAGTLQGIILEDVESDGAWMWGPFLLGMEYYREWRATGRTETDVTFQSSGKDLELFPRGKSWASVVKDLVKDGAQPSLKEMLTGKGADSHPRDLGFAFSLVRFLTADPGRRKGLDVLFRHVRKTEKYCDAHVFAAQFGYDSPDALEADWKKYIEGSGFR